MKRVLPALLLALLCACAAPRYNGLRDTLGVVHCHGRYSFGGKDFLNEGADRILELGSRVLKVWFHEPAFHYPFNSEWPEMETLVEVAKSPYFRTVFEKPFTTYIMVVYSRGRAAHYWREGVTGEQAEDETRQFHELAKHLLTEYRGTGKTFVLEHWEGDWAVRGHFDAKVDPKAEAIAGMIAWLNARQKGVDKARAEAGEQGVRVFHAAEVNQPVQEMREGRAGLTTKVLPHVNVDLVSYSSWDGQMDRKTLRAALDFIAKHAKDRPPFGNKNVYIGEFGAPENLWKPEVVKSVIPGVVETGLDWGCPWVVYWELYCNEPRDVLRPPVRPSADKPETHFSEDLFREGRVPARGNDDCGGFWMVRPDGTKSWAWHYFRDKLR